MRFDKKRKMTIYILILLIGIGFAYLSTRLNITGTANVKGNSFLIYFDNVEVSSGSVDADEPEIDSKRTTLDFSVSLENPGDYYEFYVDAVNDGTIDAMIQNVIKTEMNEQISKYVSFEVTYENGDEIKLKDVLKTDSQVTYKVFVKYRDDTDYMPEERIDLTLTFEVIYVPSEIEEESKFIKLVKDSTLSDKNIDFKQISSASNGRGLYVRSGTEEDTYPIYYYRGAVTNNNAKFAGFCWKIVRTTKTGGTKLLYNGTPNNSGQCSNTTGTSTQISTTSKYNLNDNSLAYGGYMYGTVYEVSEKTTSSSYVFGNTFTYSNGTYTLSNTRNGADNTHHYTCFNSSTSCESVNFVYNVDGSTTRYIVLSNGKSIADAIDEMQTNTTSSKIKTTLENWFNNTFKTYFTNRGKDYNDYLEDTIWCNDRSVSQENIAGWSENGDISNDTLHYDVNRRVSKNFGVPDLNCPNKRDSFTVEESSTGNGKLTYPVGLLTADEVIFAGGQGLVNSDYYLNTQQYWWTMSPDLFWEDGHSVKDVRSTGILSDGGVTNVGGVRPLISVKSRVRIASGGNGTSANPYEFVIE